MMKSHLGPEHSSTTNRIHSPSSPHWPSSTVREQAFLAMHSMHSLVRELRTCSERHLGQAHCNKPPRPQSYHNNHLVLVAASVHEKHCIPPSLRLKSTFWNSFPSHQAYTRDARDARDALSHTDTRQASDLRFLPGATRSPCRAGSGPGSARSVSNVHLRSPPCLQSTLAMFSDHRRPGDTERSRTPPRLPGARSRRPPPAPAGGLAKAKSLLSAMSLD